MHVNPSSFRWKLIIFNCGFYIKWLRYFCFRIKDFLLNPIDAGGGSKSIGLRLLKFSDFPYIPKALPVGLKPGFNTNCLRPQAHCLNDCFFLYQTKSLFWPTFTCQILIKFSFLESLWHKETNYTNFAKKINLQRTCQIIRWDD